MYPARKFFFLILGLQRCCCCYCYPSSEDDPYRHANLHDPWTERDKCQQLPYPQCQCNDTHVSCINAQMTQTDLLLHVNDYPHVWSVTFRGNNFFDLPAHILGAREYYELTYLNLSANYFVNVHPSAFFGMPNLISLDLSHNEMVFDENDTDLFTQLPQLQTLHLRKAFPRTMHNSAQQIDILGRMLRKAKLNHLRVLDLSYNELERLPDKFDCYVPNLEVLLLAGNSFRNFPVAASSAVGTSTTTTTCYRRLKRLDLADNYLARLDQPFMKFCDGMERNAVILQRNPFVCDNRSNDYIRWLRSASCVQGRESIKCQPDGNQDGPLIRLSDRRLDAADDDTSKQATSAGPLAASSFQYYYYFSLYCITVLAEFSALCPPLCPNWQ